MGRINFFSKSLIQYKISMIFNKKIIYWKISTQELVNRLTDVEPENKIRFWEEND
jgi:hypothetical protein